MNVVTSDKVTFAKVMQIELSDSCIRKLADALKQKTGHWTWVQYDSISELGDWCCSECRFMPSAFNLAKKHLNYCPNCGAYMRGEEE